MACDICGKKGTPLVDLRDVYQTKDVKAICYECERAVNRQHGKLISVAFNMLAVLLKRFIAERKASKGATQ